MTSLHDYPGAIFGWTEKSLLAWFKQNVRPGEVWLDVGAHYGYTAIALAELVGPTGHVYAFEPSLITVGYLSLTRSLNGLNQITVLPLGLSDCDEMRLATVPINRGMANHAYGGDTSEEIYLTSLDSIRRSVIPLRVDGVKIDVQGMENQVVVGMRQLLAHDRPKVVIEFHANVQRRPILELLSAVGYRIPGTPIDASHRQDAGVCQDDVSYAFEYGNG